MPGKEAPKDMNADIFREKKRIEVRQHAKDLALTGTFENFDKVMKALQVFGLDAGLDTRSLLRTERGTINRLCEKSRRNK